MWSHGAPATKNVDYSAAVRISAEARYVLPRGSKYPIFEASGPKNHAFDGFWDQRGLKYFYELGVHVLGGL